MKIVNLFGEIVEERQAAKKKTLFDDYDGFVNKFKPKLTTDDCYTPAEVYATILEWVAENYDLSGKNICRPFFPGGDYESEIYNDNDVVIDNPPFSLLTTIVDFYDKKGVKFFIFAPELTALVRNPNVCNIYSGQGITYQNGAQVATSFISNLWEDLGVWCCPELGKRIKQAQEKANAKPKPPRYIYPANVITSANVGTLASRGGTLKIPRCEISQKVGALASQKIVGKAAFGGCKLISDNAAAELKAAEVKAAELKAAELKAAEHKAAEEAIVWELSDGELDVIKILNENGKKAIND